MQGMIRTSKVLLVRIHRTHPEEVVLGGLLEEIGRLEVVEDARATTMCLNHRRTRR